VVAPLCDRDGREALGLGVTRRVLDAALVQAARRAPGVTVLDGVAARAVLFRDGRVIGLNTDVEILVGIHAAHACLIGAGGAAATLGPALPADTRVFSRRGDWPPDVRGADVVIHATPVRDEVLVELGEGQTLIDLPYPRTATAEAAAAAGARVLDGLEVLVAQGAASFELWTGLQAPVDVMRRAIGLT